MKVGTIRETKSEEGRVGLTPAGVRALVAAGHDVLIEAGAGLRSGFADAVYESGGATLAANAAEVAARVGLLVKVKEPSPAEFVLMRRGLLLFSYLNLARERGLLQALMDSGVNAIAFEGVRGPGGVRPLLAPMSRIAGRMAGEIAAQYLKRPGPGRGMLLGGVPGVASARAVVVGSGTAGTAAAEVLVALGAKVVVFGRDAARLRDLADKAGSGIAAKVLTSKALGDELAGVDVLIGAVLASGGVAPKLVSREMVRSMGEGAVIVDVGVDQGGICETSRLTTHADPVYVEEGVVHYCVPNMPGAVPRTSTEALANATLPYVLKLAVGGLKSLRDDEALAPGAAVIDGRLTAEGAAEAHGILWTPVREVLGAE